MYTKILFYRKDLFAVCGAGFVTNRIGSFWCEGWIRDERMSMLADKNIWFTVGDSIPEPMENKQ